MDTKGVYIGRFNPIHVGHGRVVRTMLNECGLKNSVIVIGSSNAEFSARNIFNYLDRTSFIKKLFPNSNVIGLPDFPDSNEAWLANLDSILEFGNFHIQDTMLYTGDANDLQAQLFTQANRPIRIVEREEMPGVSGTNVREALLNKQWDLAASMLDPIVANDIIKESKCNLNINGLC